MASIEENPRLGFIGMGAMLVPPRLRAISRPLRPVTDV